MTQALALSQPEELAPQRDPMADFRAMQEQAKALVKSGFLPRAVDTPEKAIAIIQTGRELGIGPMQALRCIHILDAKPVMAAELIAGLVLARHRGALLRVVKTTEKECVVHAARAGQEMTEYRFTIEDAQRAGLTGKQNWRNYPRAMLRNRALAEAARGTFPDATLGLYDPDELGAVTTERGEIASVRPLSVAEVMAEDEPLSDATESPFHRLRDQLATLEELVAKCTTYDQALTIRAELGSRAKQSQLLRELQEASGKGEGPRTITGAEHKQLSAAWGRADRQLSKKEAALAPRVEASFIDDEPEAERQPGEDDQ